MSTRTVMRLGWISTIKCQRSRLYSTLLPKARLNTPTDFEATSLLNHNSRSALASKELSSDAKNGTATRLNLFQAINSALSHALRTDPRVLLFGEDVAFGGVFRCRYRII
jgi:2-oxoisovalerate dehydrogenase E1 component beta subunit